MLMMTHRTTAWLSLSQEGCDILCKSLKCYVIADVRCYAYSPPGGLMSRNLSRIAERVVVSIVVGKDVVPRMSVVNLGRLIDQMVRQARDCDQEGLSIGQLLIDCSWLD